jgi:chemotaxis response regulator CheB
MSPKSILVFNTQSLLAGDVKSLLNSGDDFIVASILFADGIALIQEIEQSKPDIVIVDDETNATSGNIENHTSSAASDS